MSDQIIYDIYRKIDKLQYEYLHRKGRVEIELSDLEKVLVALKENNQEPDDYRYWMRLRDERGALIQMWKFGFDLRDQDVRLHKFLDGILTGSCGYCDRDNNMGYDHNEKR